MADAASLRTRYSERMVVYPIIIWEIALGASLMSGAIFPSHGEKD